MATTTNYGWTTPDDTALVKDGAAAIRTLGTSVDTTTKNLNPSIALGDIEYRSSTPNVNTRLPLGTAGQVLKVNSGATAPEWATDATGMTNPMTTTGDTIYSSSGSTPARLPIGSTGNVLTVAGGLPTWAAPASGGMTLLSTTNLTGSSVSLNSIPQTYRYLVLFIRNATNSTGTTTSMRVNNIGFFQYTNVLASNSTLNVGMTQQFNLAPANNTNAQSMSVVEIPDYAFGGSPTIFKINSFAGWTSGANVNQINNIGLYGDAGGGNAIDSIQLFPPSATFTGGEVQLWGVK